MKKLSVITTLLLASQILSASVAMATTSIKAEVNGMVCAFCAKGIEKKLNAMPEGQASFVDLKSRVVVLELKEGKEVPLEKFSQVIKDAGYTVSKVEKVSLSAEAIKAQVMAPAQAGKGAK